MHRERCVTSQKLSLSTCLRQGAVAVQGRKSGLGVAWDNNGLWLLDPGHYLYNTNYLDNRAKELGQLSLVVKKKLQLDQTVVQCAEIPISTPLLHRHCNRTWLLIKLSPICMHVWFQLPCTGFCVYDTIALSLDRISGLLRLVIGKGSL